MAVLGASVKTLKPWITHGSRRIGSCTTRHKKTMRRKMRRGSKSISEILAAYKPSCVHCETPLVSCSCPGLYCPQCEPECMSGKIGEIPYRTTLRVDPKIPPFPCALPVLPPGLRKGEAHGQ